MFPDDVNIFYLNQEISQYLYKNILFNNRNFYDDIMIEYKNLYTDILKPTESLLTKIKNYTHNKKNIIGIQIRTGDNNILTNKGEKHYYFTDLHNTLPPILKNIKIKCDSENIEYNIFLTSDYSDIYNIANKIWDSDIIIHNHDIAQHIDRQPIQSDISKIFIDSYILSQFTNCLFISDYSNFARIAALSCNHDNIYDLYCKKLDKKKLLSKYEIII